jgi:hypothetical protein
VSFWWNLIGYQVAWFLTVFGASRGLSWLGIAAGLLFAAANLALSNQRALDFKLIALAIMFGVLSDGGLVMCRLIDYAAPTPALPAAPLWIVTLWMAFSTTLNRSLTWLQRRSWVAAAFGAVGGPLAYSAAARAGALQFEAPEWRAEMWLAVSWALSMYLFARVIEKSAPLSGR